MNAKQLVDKVINNVTEIDFDEAEVLEKLNEGQVELASRLLLPGLSDGYDTVTTVTTGPEVPMPDDYMKELLSARVVDGSRVKVVANFGLFDSQYGPVDSTTGSVVACVAHGRNLIYQNVPGVAKSIQLWYYRLPTPMQYREDSFPDGVEFFRDYSTHFQKALFHYACQELWAEIEQGEGNKPDTSYHEAKFEQYVRKLNARCNKARPHMKVPQVKGNW